MKTAGRALLFLLFSFHAAFARNAYQRAQDLMESDPLEAEALLADFVENTENEKLRRAAYYQLFYQRLRYNRLAEAFRQSASGPFAARYREAVAEELDTSTAQAAKLVSLLRKTCGKKSGTENLAQLLGDRNLPPMAYDYTLRVLRRCKVEGLSGIFDEELFATGKPSRRQTALRLIAIREQLHADAAKAAELLAIAAAEAPEDQAFTAQTAVLAARIAAVQGHYDEVGQRCDEIPAGKKALPARTACLYLRAHALLASGKPAEAHRLLEKLKIPAHELDNRLLFLVTGVAAGRIKGTKLRAFTQRASYGYCAATLRQLATETLESLGAK